MSATTTASAKWLALLITGLILAGCATVDIGGPRTSKRNPDAGILQLEDGKRIAVLPAELNYTGAATYTWPDGRTQQGTWLNGRLNGMGTEATATAVYTGQWQDGQRHGHGELTTTSGTRYVGDFAAGARQGKGTQTSARGVYRGTWQNNRRHGQGQFNAADGSLYQGQWHAGQRNGYGRETFANGGVYEGDWLDDKPHGFGHFYFADASTYEGRWQDGMRAGYGVWVSPADVRYEGTWQADKQHGFGKEIRPDGSYFAGQWGDGVKHGDGREVHPDGSSHEGQWQDGEINGPGHRTSRAGVITAGHWQQDSITRGRLLLPSGASYEGDLFGPDGRSVAAGLMQWLTSPAQAQDPHAQYFLGIAHLDFDDPQPDTNAALVWLQRAAAAGVAEAEFRLSILLRNDDIGSALRWLVSAAAQDHPGANETLGGYYHTGQYVQRDLAKAIKHYEKAAARGSVNATNNLAWLLATAEDSSFADPQRAVDLIRPFVLFLGYWQHLDTLAAAHARLGDTALAQRMQTQALIQARSTAPEQTITEMAARLELYGNDTAYVE